MSLIAIIGGAALVFIIIYACSKSLRQRQEKDNDNHPTTIEPDNTYKCGGCPYTPVPGQECGYASMCPDAPSRNDND